MPSSMLVTTTIATAVVAALTVRYYSVWAQNSSRKEKRIRQKLPCDLDTWRIPGKSQEDEEKIWQDLDEVFRDTSRGFTLWTNAFGCTLVAPSEQLSSGFAYATPGRGIVNRLGTVQKLRRFDYINPLTRIARTQEGHDVPVRVIVIREEGNEHLKILRRIATGPYSLLSNNQTLPMLGEFQFEDIIFGLFPKAGGTMDEAFSYWPKNSVGDVIDMLMQALEALAFIHDLHIAHRDAFRDNFVVQWYPESLLTMKIPVSRPRVYLIDFEVAVEFPPDFTAAECVSTGYPLGGSFQQPEMYSRPLPSELTAGKPYSPFKLDVWQLGSSFSEFKTTIEAIDDILVNLADFDPVFRKDANEALERLGKVVQAMTPESLLIQPDVPDRFA